MHELTWFPFSILATILFGVAMAFYKFPAAKAYSRSLTAFGALFVPAILSLIFFYSYLPLTTSGMLWLALLWGISFPIIMLLQMYALNHVDTNVLFPITSTTSLMITVLIGIFAFGERVTFIQGLGIALAIFTVFQFIYRRGKLQFKPLMFGVGSGIIFLSAFNKVLQKIVADNIDIHAFQIYQYIFATIVMFFIILIEHRKKWKLSLFFGALKIGVPIGIFSFFGGYSLYLALTKGLFSLIISIHSLYIFVTALTAYFLFHEKITIKKIFLIMLAVISIIFMRMG